MLERRREPHLSWNCTAPPSETIQRPPRSRIGGYGSVLRPDLPNLSNYDFFANLLAGAWRRRGCRLKRLLRRWGPGGKRSRDTPPTPPPPPPRFGAEGERKRVFTLSAFGNHPTRPPRSADTYSSLAFQIAFPIIFIIKPFFRSQIHADADITAHQKPSISYKTAHSNSPGNHVC